MTFILKPYQAKAVEILDNSLQNGINPLLTAFMGSGKSVMTSFAIKNYIESNESSKILILVHRRNLVNQLKKTFDRVIPKKYLKNINYTTRQNCNTTKGYKNNITDFKPDLIFVDEAHQIANKSYRKILKDFKGLVLGCTATPIRADKQDITDILTPVHTITHRDLHSSGDAVPLKIFKSSSTSNNMKMISGNTRGSTTDSKLPSFEVVLNTLSDLDLLSTKIIIFCSDNNIAKSMTEFFNDNFITCEMVKGSDNEKKREVVLNKFKEGSTQILINSLLYTEGFDCPEINTVVIYKKKCHVSILWQMIGRVTRLYPGKKHCNVVDFGNTSHKYFNADFICEKEKDTQGITPMKECDECFAENHLTADRCVSCSKEFSKKCKKCGTKNRILSRRCTECEDFFAIGNSNKKITSINACFFDSGEMKVRSLYNKKTRTGCLILKSKATLEVFIIIKDGESNNSGPEIVRIENGQIEDVERAINIYGLSVYDIVWFGKPSPNQKLLIQRNKLIVRNINSNLEVSSRISLYMNKGEIRKLLPDLPLDFYNYRK